MTPAPAAFRVSPVDIEKRFGPVSEALQPVGTVSLIVARSGVALLGIQQSFGCGGFERGDRDAETRRAIAGRGASAEERPGGRSNDDVVVFLVARRAVLADPDQRAAR